MKEVSITVKLLVEDNENKESLESMVYDLLDSEENGCSVQEVEVTL